jgi:hypothetical protein
MTDSEMIVESLESTVVAYEAYAGSLEEDKRRMAFALLDTEDYSIMGGSHKETLKRFNFSDIEIKSILDEIDDRYNEIYSQE